MKALLGLAVALCAWGARADDGVDWVPFITTPERVVERMLELAGTGADDLVLDLGSGDGRIVIAAARRFGARGLGIELDARLIDESRRNARLAGVAERVSFVRGNVLTADISQASVVTLYLLPGLIGKLKPRFLGELEPGTRIVAHAFSMAGWEPDRVETVHLAESHPGQGETSVLYLWVVPAEVRGVWEGGGRRFTISQNYQAITVAGAERASLLGREIAWQAGKERFRGRVDGARMQGELTAADGSHAPLELRRVD